MSRATLFRSPTRSTRAVAASFALARQAPGRSPSTSRSRVGAALTVAATLLLAPVATLRAQDSTAAKPAVAGVYTDEQATRGNGVFSKVCLECHTPNDVSGKDFRLNWNGRSLFDLFDRIRTTMPEAAPGSLTREEYTDVTAYILKLNGMPIGTTPMPGDSTLTSIKLDIPAPPPSFLLVSRAGRRSPVPAIHAPLPARPRAAASLLFRGF